MQDFAAQMTDLTTQMFMNCQECEAYFVSLYGIKVAEFRCLRLLLQHDHRSVKDLAEMMHLTPSRLTRIIDGLIKRKFVVRTEDQSDRRIKVISLTQKGKDNASSMNQQYLEMHRNILSYIPEDSREQILHSVDQLLAAMRQWENDARMTDLT